MSLRRRTTLTGVTRRPRVAGLSPATIRAGNAAATPPTDGPVAAGGVPTGAPAGAGADATEPVRSTPPEAMSAPAVSTPAASAPASGSVTVPVVVSAPPSGGVTVPVVVSAPAPGDVTTPVAVPDAGRAPVAATPPARAGRGWVAALRARRVPVLAVALAVSASLAVASAVADHMVRTTPSAANTALVDVGTTSDVATQLGSALETVYSYDFARLDENERQARQVITPEFAVKFDQLFAQVRQLAPQQQAVVSATVAASAVQSIEGDRAVLVAFLDQQATRANAGSQPQQLTAAGRLTVVGQRDGDVWKIADVINR